MSAAALVLLGVLAMAVLTLILYLRRYPEPELTPADGTRLKWVFAGVVVWTLVFRGLATEVSHSCAVDSRWLSYRSGLSGFWDCSPKLLSGGAEEIFIFFWAWAPFALITVFCVRHLLRMAGRPHRDSKES